MTSDIRDTSKEKALPTVRLRFPSTELVLQKTVLFFKIFKSQSFQNFIQRKILPTIRLGFHQRRTFINIFKSPTSCCNTIKR